MRKTILLLLLLLLCGAALRAQTYDVSFSETPVEQALRQLKRQTGYDFIAQKNALEGIGPLTCSYKGLSFNQLLERVIYQDAGLDYEVVKRTVVLRKRSRKSATWFKRLVVGIVTDEEQEPVIGASVRLRGTDQGASTDVDGQFTLMVEGRDPLLDISCIGMQPVSVSPRSGSLRNGNSFVQVTMRPDVKLMDEVLVTGYQNIKRENATGSYQYVTGEQMEKRYTGDVLSNLEGRVPGLVQYNNGVTEEGETSLTIRGAGSFQAKTNPLVVVDGLPIEGGLNSVNPYNIASITVLKDAAAASIYGARASNGVIVITTKQAREDRLSIDFNADLSISENKDYQDMRWASASELIELERNNFQYVRNLPNQTPFKNLQSTYKNNVYAVSPITRLLMANYLGTLSGEELESRLSALGRNNYYKEWQDAWERPQITHQYNLSMRNRGKYLNNSLVLNYKGDNEGVRQEHEHTYQLNYKGEMEVARWLSVEFGANFITRRQKTHITSLWNQINSFYPYQSMYNADGSRADMEAGAWLGEESLQNTALGLKSESYNLLDEVGRNFNRLKENNLRTFAHATLHLLPGWNWSGQFQYEDIYSQARAYKEADSYDMRHLYNLYTATDGTHYLPDAGMLQSSTAQGDYYTFRTQTDYEHTFGTRHQVELLAGFEYRQTRYTSEGYTLVGYDDDSQTNNMGTTSFTQFTALSGSTSALGSHYTMVGAPDGSDYTSSDVLHRYYSYYFNGNYVYDHRYTASASYRVDKTDLFGADPKFRGRPLWSVGAGWNLMNESFMKDVKWLDALKLRMSYGLTGNIDQNVSSYLTASVAVNELNGSRVATLNTPPNDQLRWEKTASFNVGVDFAVLKGRLSGALDVYRKKGSDLLTVTDLDPTTGWTSLTINNGEALNRGVELQLNGVILKAASPRRVGISAALSFAYNRNEVTSINHAPSTGYEAMEAYTLHEGSPIHSLYSYRYAGLKNIKGVQYFGWIDHEGVTHYSDTDGEDFTAADAVYCGSLDPRFVASLTPEVTWRGFTLSALLCYYGGHKMRACSQDWSYEGSQYGYCNLSQIEAIPAAYLRYWESDDDIYPPNGYAGGSNVVGDYIHMDANVVPADFLKLRTLSLSYAVPRGFCQRLHTRSLSLRLQVSNLCCWKRNNLGIDPEACSPTTGDLSVSTPRSYTMSVSAGF